MSLVKVDQLTNLNETHVVDTTEIVNSVKNRRIGQVTVTTNASGVGQFTVTGLPTTLSTIYPILQYLNATLNRYVVLRSAVVSSGTATIIFALRNDNATAAASESATINYWF